MVVQNFWKEREGNWCETFPSSRAASPSICIVTPNRARPFALPLTRQTMQSLRRSLVATAAAASFARVGAAAPAAPFAHQSLQRRHQSTQSTEALAEELVSECDKLLAAGKRINWVFLGAPGVGKGTYATRISKLMNIPHISAGDLVRDEIKRGTPLGAQVRAFAIARFFSPPLYFGFSDCIQIAIDPTHSEGVERENFRNATATLSAASVHHASCIHQTLRGTDVLHVHHTLPTYSLYPKRNPNEIFRFRKNQTDGEDHKHRAAAAGRRHPGHPEEARGEGHRGGRARVPAGRLPAHGGGSPS
jgi:hypothetical protein